MNFFLFFLPKWTEPFVRHFEMRRDEDRSVGCFFILPFFRHLKTLAHAHNLITAIRQPLVPFHTLFTWSRSISTEEKIEIITRNFFPLLLLCTPFVYANEYLLHAMWSQHQCFLLSSSSSSGTNITHLICALYWLVWKRSKTPTQKIRSSLFCAADTPKMLLSNLMLCQKLRGKEKKVENWLWAEVWRCTI